MVRRVEVWKNDSRICSCSTAFSSFPVKLSWSIPYLIRIRKELWNKRNVHWYIEGPPAVEDRWFHYSWWETGNHVLMFITIIPPIIPPKRHWLTLASLVHFLQLHAHPRRSQRMVMYLVTTSNIWAACSFGVIMGLSCAGHRSASATMESGIHQLLFVKVILKCCIDRSINLYFANTVAW